MKVTRIETLRWTRAGVRLGIASGADGEPLLTIQRAPAEPVGE